MRFIFGCIPHRRDINKLDLVNGLRGTNGAAARRVKRQRPSAGAASFCHTISEEPEFHNSHMGKNYLLPCKHVREE